MELTKRFVVGVCIVMAAMFVLGAALGIHYSHSYALQLYQGKYNEALDRVPPCASIYNQPLGLDEYFKNQNATKILQDSIDKGNTS